MTKSTDAMLAIARDLADALINFARDRRPDDQKEIARLHTELCKARWTELQPSQEETKE
jgi:hypothetical protein